MHKQIFTLVILCFPSWSLSSACRERSCLDASVRGREVMHMKVRKSMRNKYKVCPRVKGSLGQGGVVVARG